MVNWSFSMEKLGHNLVRSVLDEWEKIEQCPLQLVFENYLQLLLKTISLIVDSSCALKNIITYLEKVCQNCTKISGIFIPQIPQILVAVFSVFPLQTTHQWITCANVFSYNGGRGISSEKIPVYRIAGSKVNTYVFCYLLPNIAPCGHTNFHPC